MESISLFTAPVCRLHSAGVGHPERPERIDAVDGVFAGMVGTPGVHLSPGHDADDADILRVHTIEHLETVRESATREVTIFDADTIANRHSFDAAIRAAGCACSAVDEVCTGVTRRAFVGTRPPGHHAESDHTMGFCFFNNVAVAAERARKVYGLERVAIIDWDVHHGNGTMNHFVADPGVLFVSLHQYPLFPGTGRLEDSGEGEGIGYSLNLPLSEGRTDSEYLYLFDSLVLPLLDRFEPQLVLVSAGYDAHERDPLGSMLLSGACFAQMASRLAAVADRHAAGRMVAILEGGYSLGGVEDGVRNTIAGMIGGAFAAEVSHTLIDTAVERFAELAAHRLSRHWGEFPL